MKNIIKLVALITCLVMMLSFVGAAADTKLYLDYDFAKHVADPSAATAAAAEVEALRQAFAAQSIGQMANDTGDNTTAGIRTRALTNGGLASGYGWSQIGDSAVVNIVKNNNGDWMFATMTAGAANSTNMNYFIVPEEMWVMVDGETCIISYDTMVMPGANAAAYTAQPNNNDIDNNAVYWTNADGSKTFDDANLGLSAADDGAGGLTHSVIFSAGYSTTNKYDIAPNVANRTAFGFKKHTDNGGADGAERTFAARSFALNGEYKLTVNNRNDGNGKYAYIGNNAQYGGSVGLHEVDRIGAIRLGSFKNNGLAVGKAFGKIRMYSVKDNSFVLTADKTTNVPVDTEKVTVKFGNPVAAATFDSEDVVVKANGVAVDASDYTVSNFKDFVKSGTEVYATVDVEFNKQLAFGKTYTVEFAETVANELGTTLGANNTVSFATEAAPTYTLTLSACEGVKAGGTAISNLASAAGKTVCLTANAVNDLYGKAVEDVITIGIYDSEDNLVKYAYASKALALNGSASFTAVFKIGANQTAKAFIGDTVVVLGQN